MSEKFNFYKILKTTIEEDESIAVATVVASKTEAQIELGAKLLVFADGKQQGSLGNADWDQKVAKDAVTLLAKEVSKTVSYKFGEVYIESVVPPPPLVIIGGDADAVPIVTFAKELGFKVVLVDHRPNVANKEKFPGADDTIVSPVEELSGNLKINEKTFVLIKTHNYLKDKEILKFVLKAKPRYVGQLGPKARMDDLLKNLSDEGIAFSKEELSSLYAPVGLDIGAESPEQIALSILTEMLAVKNGRAGGFLKNQTEAIHPRS